MTTTDFTGGDGTPCPVPEDDQDFDIDAASMPSGASLQTVVPKLIADYIALAASPAPADHKSIAAFHTACRGALAHLATLLRLLQNSETVVGEPSEDAAGPAIDDLIAEARDILARQTEEHT